ncbi:hypothetical protein ACFFX0_03125 [Citricoccus parietis]|uniref:Uncharacterized protein n=1 Tax=Citricoccus parietis TaxID=592307 RepID=A0ABV5FUV6_9MICC
MWIGTGSCGGWRLRGPRITGRGSRRPPTVGRTLGAGSMWPRALPPSGVCGRRTPTG